MIVSFSRITGLVLGEYALLYKSLFEEDMTLTFHNYVKSQVHLPILPDLYGRDVLAYLETLKYIAGESKDVVSCEKVLRFFYQDMFSMLCNAIKSSPDIEITIWVQAEIPGDNHFPVITRSLDEVKLELEELLADPDKDTPYAGVFYNFSAKERLTLRPSNALAMASILFQLVNVDASPSLLEVVK